MTILSRDPLTIPASNLFLSWGDFLLLITAPTPLYFLEIVCWDLTVSGVGIKDGDNRQHLPIPELPSNNGLNRTSTELGSQTIFCYPQTGIWIDDPPFIKLFPCSFSNSLIYNIRCKESA